MSDDADTTGAVCGQFARAYWGQSGIPKEARGLGSAGDDREGIARAVGQMQ
jgi:hypothetical protein